MKGGETSFPRWKNAETDQALTVVPEVGKAILFYNQLADGNYDDVSKDYIVWGHLHISIAAPLVRSYSIFVWLLSYFYCTTQLSQHAAMPVLEGEKWLTNLWVWVSRARFLSIILSALYE
jgi:prolyl 4-hydroxylase